MTKEREALKQIAGFTLSQFMGPHDMALACVDVAREALAQPEQEPIDYKKLAALGWQAIECSICGSSARAFPRPEQKPMATNKQISEWANRHDFKGTITDLRCAFEDAQTVCTNSPQRKPLTDEQMDAVTQAWAGHSLVSLDRLIMCREYARAIEAAHGIKGDA